MANNAPININGKTMLFLNWTKRLVGLRNKTNKAVATLSLNKPIVSGVAEVNFIKTGTPAIKINVITASAPIFVLLGLPTNSVLFFYYEHISNTTNSPEL